MRGHGAHRGNPLARGYAVQKAQPKTESRVDRLIAAFGDIAEELSA
jgi:hypothetical protein